MHTAAISLTLAISLAPSACGFSEQDADPAATTDRFELRSDSRVGLHHLLLHWAAADAGEWPSYAPPVVERESWRSQLDEDETRIWSGALEPYSASLGRSLLFDRGLLALRDWAAGSGRREAIPPADRPLARALEAALPVYRRHWWPEHDRRNREWIESVAPRLDEIEEAVTPRLEAAYGGSWPDARIPVDVVPYANPVGAYSTAGRLTISSLDPDNGMPQAVELLFHEASHLDPLEEPLRAGLRQAFSRVGGEPPDRLWHDLIFYTAGEITRIVLAEWGDAGYRHYGEVTGVYRRGARWPSQLAAFVRHWRPFLHAAPTDDGARREALEALARELVPGS